MPSLKEFLDKLFAISKGEDLDAGFLKALKGLPAFEVEQRIIARRRALAKFLKHHVCTGVFNGSPVWRRLPSFYDRGKKQCRTKGGNVPGGVRRAMARVAR